MFHGAKKALKHPERNCTSLVPPSENSRPCVLIGMKIQAVDGLISFHHSQTAGVTRQALAKKSGNPDEKTGEFDPTPDCLARLPPQPKQTELNHGWTRMNTDDERD
jgi:hypothetical protein